MGVTEPTSPFELHLKLLHKKCNCRTLELKTTGLDHLHGLGPFSTDIRGLKHCLWSSYCSLIPRLQLWGAGGGQPSKAQHETEAPSCQDEETEA